MVLLTPPIQAILSVNDDGPHDSTLHRVIPQLKGHGAVLMRQALCYATTYTERAKTLCHLIAEYDALDCRKQAECSLYSVARFIFTSNKIEHAGLSTESDTRAAILAASTAPRSIANVADRPGLNDVLRTLDLLTTTFDQAGKEPCRNCAEPQSRLSFDIPTLQAWHTTLFSLTLPSAGRFRSAGAFTDGHKYPHHSVLRHGMETLSRLVYELWKGVASSGFLDHGRVLWCFALAAFAQFHLVDQHPFVDGNGRMCRFLSKRVLDWVLPVPIAMFPDRSPYFEALISGRREASALHAPSALMGLLLDTAITHYQEMVNSGRQWDEIIVVQSEAEVEKLPAELKESFREMKEGETRDVQVGDRRVRLHRYPSLCLDDV
jgi:fido (protein-threonine AMPylation protein)